MKKLWWVTLVVFLLGIGVGRGIDVWQERRNPDMPYFTTAPNRTQLSATEATQPPPTIQQTGQESDGQMLLPCKLQYTSLEAQMLTAYDGPYPEDGTEDALFGVAALVLRNTGTIGIEYAQIVLTQDGRELYFDATYIAPKSTVLVLEENRSLYSESPVTDCRCRTVIPGAFDLEERTVVIKESGMCSLEVTNLTDRELGCVRVFYKQYVADADMYVGGITYSAIVPNMKPGETRVITPYRYASGYARLVAVVTEG